MLPYLSVYLVTILKRYTNSSSLSSMQSKYQSTSNITSDWRAQRCGSQQQRSSNKVFCVLQEFMLWPSSSGCNKTHVWIKDPHPSLYYINDKKKKCVRQRGRKQKEKNNKQVSALNSCMLWWFSAVHLVETIFFFFAQNASYPKSSPGLCYVLESRHNIYCSWWWGG